MVIVNAAIVWYGQVIGTWLFLTHVDNYTETQQLM